jgi:predicted Zn-dependent protease
MDRDTALDICRKAVGFASTDDALAVLRERRSGSTRFSNNVITQNVAERRADLTVRVAFGKQRGEVTSNRFDEESLRAAVARAEAIARVAPEDEEHLPPAEPDTFRDLPGEDPGTAEIGPGQRAEGVGAALSTVEGHGLKAAGAYATSGSSIAFANRRGAEGHQTRSDADMHATVLTGTSSGWAEEISRAGSEVDPERTASRACELAKMAADPREIEPGEYDVVLAPAATCEMIAFLLFSSDAKAADEGRSALSGKQGQKIAGDNVTIRSRLDDPSWPGLKFDGEGVPLDDVTWYENGVLKSLHTSRYWAQHTNRAYTPYPGTISMDGSDLSVDDLVSRLDRGLLVTRFWYTRFVDPMTLLITGMTRDALFLVEGGKIVSGVKHLRFNDSPIRMLDSVKAVGKPEVASMYIRGRVPPLLVEGFRFTSGTSF